MNKNNNVKENIPIAYFLTITCYGTWLHGDADGSVDPDQNVFDTPFLPEDSTLHEIKRKKMDQDPYKMDREQRKNVLQTIRSVCSHRDWFLIAAHVRSTHVHIVVHACQTPERMMNDIKSYASRRLNEAGYDHSDRKRWTRHGSSQYLFSLDSVQAAIRYTLHEQGEPMSVYLHDTMGSDVFREYAAETNRVLRTFFQEEGILDDRGEVVVHD